MVTNNKSDKGKVRVFVYGTLRSGQMNNELMKKARADIIGRDTITGPYTLFDLGGFPCIQQTGGPKDKETTILGEIYALDDEGLAALDHFEGHPTFFERRKIWSDKMGKRVWVYFMNHEDITNGKPNLNATGIWNPLNADDAYWKAHKAQSSGDSATSSK